MLPVGWILYNAGLTVHNIIYNVNTVTIGSFRESGDINAPTSDAPGT